MRVEGEIDNRADSPPPHDTMSQNAEEASWQPISIERHLSPEL